MNKYSLRQYFDAYKMPNEEDEVTNDFFDWAEQVGLEFESGRNSTLIVLNKHSINESEFEDDLVVYPTEWLVKNENGYFFKMSDQEFNEKFVETIV